MTDDEILMTKEWLSSNVKNVRFGFAPLGIPLSLGFRHSSFSPLFLFLAEQLETTARFTFLLLHFHLSKDGNPTDKNFVPLIFEAANDAFRHFAQITNGRRTGNERKDF